MPGLKEECLQFLSTKLIYKGLPGWPRIQEILHRITNKPGNPNLSRMATIETTSTILEL